MGGAQVAAAEPIVDAGQPPGRQSQRQGFDIGRLRCPAAPGQHRLSLVEI